MERIDKLYITLKCNQWRGKPIYVEDEIDINGYYIRFPDIQMDKGMISTIFAEFSDSNGGTYAVSCDIVEVEKRLIKVMIPLEILSNKGLYKVVFSVAYNETGEIKRSAVQTFEVKETITISDDNIKQDTNYPILIELIEELSKYKVDTSIFPTREEMVAYVSEQLKNMSLEAIVEQLTNIGYITRTDMEKILKNYATIASMSQYATHSDLKAYVKYIEYNTTKQQLTDLVNSMSNYVLKEPGKGLSTHDLTDELYEILIRQTGGNGEIPKELLDKINASISKTEVEKNYYNKVEIDKKEGLLNTRIDNLNSGNILHNNKTLDSVLDDILYKKPSIIRFSSNLNKFVYKIGESIANISFSWEISDNVKTIKLRVLNSTQDKYVNLPLGFSTYDLSTPINETTDFILMIEDEKLNIDKKIIHVDFVNPFYIGSSIEGAGGICENLTNIVEGVAYLKEDRVVNISCNDQRPFIAYPKEYGLLDDLTDKHGLSYLNSLTIHESFKNNITYYVYIFNEKIIMNNMKLTIIFNK